VLPSHAVRTDIPKKNHIIALVTDGAWDLAVASPELEAIDAMLSLLSKGFFSRRESRGGRSDVSL